MVPQQTKRDTETERTKLTNSTNMRIPLHRPLQRNLARALQLQALHPLTTVRLILALSNLLRQLLRPLLRRGKRPSANTMLLMGNNLLRNAGVPHMMQIKPLVVEEH